MKFDRSNDPTPMTASHAVSRGEWLINWPVRIIMILSFVGAWLLSDKSGWLAAIVALSGFAVAWLWWSYSTPQWRQWALQRGADPDELQVLALKAQLVWSKGLALERTEFRNRKRY